MVKIGTLPNVPFLKYSKRIHRHFDSIRFDIAFICSVQQTKGGGSPEPFYPARICLDSLTTQNMAATEKDQAVIAAAKELQHVPWSEEYEKMISGMLYV